MKKILLTLLVLTSILGTGNCSPKKKSSGTLEQLVPLALLGGNTGDVANANSTDGEQQANLLQSLPLSNQSLI